MRYLIRRARTLAKVAVPTAVAGALLALPAVAGATVVTPEGEAFTATNDGPTTFVVDNGTGVGLSCEESIANGEIPPAGGNNNNDNPDGSVFVRLTSITYDDCTEDVFDTTVTVDTSLKQDAWSVSAMALEDGSNNETDDALTVAVPPAGVEIDVPILSCTITVPQDGSTPVAAAVIGDWEDGTQMNPTSRLSIDEQLPFSGCGLGSPAVYSGEYDVESDDSSDPIVIDES